MKSGEEERHFRKGTSYKRPSGRRGVAAEQTYKRERGSRFVDRPAGAYGEAVGGIRCPKQQSSGWRRDGRKCDQESSSQELNSVILTCSGGQSGG